MSSSWAHQGQRRGNPRGALRGVTLVRPQLEADCQPLLVAIYNRIQGLGFGDGGSGSKLLERVILGIIQGSMIGGIKLGA